MLLPPWEEYAEAGVSSWFFTLHSPLKRDERLDDIVRLGRHHSERSFDFCK